MLSVLSIADISFGVFFRLFLPVGYFSQKSIARIASDMAFVEGAVIFFAGAVMAFYHSSFSMTVKILMITGATMLVLSVVFGLLS